MHLSMLRPITYSGEPQAPLLLHDTGEDNSMAGSWLSLLPAQALVAVVDQLELRLRGVEWHE